LPLGALVARVAREPCLGVPPSGIVCALSQQDGFARVVLKTSDHVSGENYRVEASTDSAFSCGTGCPRSGTITTWKRVYVEVNRMFRTGTFISEPVQTGDDSIAVTDASVFPAPPFLIRLIHAPLTVSNSPAPFYDEVFTVLEVRMEGGWPFGTRPGTLHLGDPNVPKKKAVTAFPYGSIEQVRGRVRTYLADAVGLLLPSASRTYYDVNHDLANPLFADAFVELAWIFDASPNTVDIRADHAVPYVPAFKDTPLDTPREWFTRKWLRSADRHGEDRTAYSNHQELFIGTAQNNPNEYLNASTSVADEFNELWMFLKTMPAAYTREGLTHELGHQWRVNRISHTNPPGGLDGHCDTAIGQPVMMYNDAARYCTMTRGDILYAGGGQPKDGRVGFHYEVIGGAPDSEYLRIRERSEPIPQNEIHGRVLR
jgi:hypothetical protein